tara:strand:- start:80 stop:304 length:225 start_codon:yes stop_codon:yes gene_type:complete
MYKKNMAKFIEELSDLPLETQESVLKNLSEDLVPIEIDMNVYMIHKEVSDLIDNLVLQIETLNEERETWPKNDS